MPRIRVPPIFGAVLSRLNRLIHAAFLYVPQFGDSPVDPEVRASVARSAKYLRIWVTLSTKAKRRLPSNRLRRPGA